jgi:hypothetical protein
MSQRNNMQTSLKESQIQLALQAIQRNATLTIQAAAQLYNVSYQTLSNRRAGKLS